MGGGLGDGRKEILEPVGLYHEIINKFFKRWEHTKDILDIMKK